MVTDPYGVPTPRFPPGPSPNLRHLEGPAKDLRKSGAAASLAGNAHFQIAAVPYTDCEQPTVKALTLSLRVDPGNSKAAPSDSHDIARVQCP